MTNGWKKIPSLNQALMAFLCEQGKHNVNKWSLELYGTNVKKKPQY